MAHYAFIDENSIVQNVSVGMDETDTSELADGYSTWEAYYTDSVGMTCKRTSYNTNGNAHSDGGTPFRGNYASIGGTYDSTNDVFYEVDPSTEGISYTLNTSTWIWEKDE